MENKPYYVYMLRCKDNSIYTGITTDIKRRMQEHCSKNEKCAKYTMHHTAEKMEITWETENSTLASKLEYHIKKLSKQEKEKLIQDANYIKSLLKEKIDSSKYKKIL